MTKDLKNDRWTCPNDRNLQLRSKLNAGWSIHTGKKTVKKDPQLTESELIEIQKVLQRSEMLERKEQERVMRLVDRLENMKRNVNQSSCSPSTNRCALCGDFFCLIRTAPNQCSSCNKIVCNKCCIDTECTLDNTETSSIASQSRKNSSSSLSMTASFISASSSNNKVTVYLCRICSEQREFLKKSGAWFIRKYPNYMNNSGSISNGQHDGIKFNSTSNISQLEKSPPTQAKTKSSFASPFSLKRNISVSSANSSTFRFWKFSNNNSSSNNNNNNNAVQNYVNDISDNVSDFSIDNERTELDLNSNYDSNSITTRTASSDNLNVKTPASPNKTKEVFQFSNNNENNSAIQLNGSSYNYSNFNSNLSNNNQKTDTNSTSPFIQDKQKTFNFTKSENTSTKTKTEKEKQNKTKELNLSDDESSSSYMSNYNYYSNILSNLNPNSPQNLIKLENELPNPDEIILNKSYSKKNKNTSVGSITDVILNSSLSASASNLNTNYPPSPCFNIKLDLNKTKTTRRTKNAEWCSTQLSMDDESTNASDYTRKNLFSKPKINNNNSVSSTNLMNANNDLTKNHKLKISSQTINNLANKIINQSNSVLPVGSIAGSGSSVLSASSLTTSLAKLNSK